jgi:hypothetical protein
VACGTLRCRIGHILHTYLTCCIAAYEDLWKWFRRGAHAPSHVVFDALVENLVQSPATPIFGEGAKDNTRGRVCSPRLPPGSFARRVSTNHEKRLDQHGLGHVSTKSHRMIFHTRLPIDPVKGTGNCHRTRPNCGVNFFLTFYNFYLAKPEILSRLFT